MALSHELLIFLCNKIFFCMRYAYLNESLLFFPLQKYILKNIMNQSNTVTIGSKTHMYREMQAL